ncbi:putative Ig domain-containing protein [Nocardioides baekrokdamisoli]|uniref:putative Ig domain-containing protein n=1 Tax=Nocardioides baekrokdamisoli TaxID=1804624 RepID=UPI0018D50F33|nr:putative Ig domain-containing protein [Nocardioides baekrokdamisoli]
MSFVAVSGRTFAAVAAIAATLALTVMPSAAQAATSQPPTPSIAHPLTHVRLGHIGGIVPQHKGGTLPGNHHAAAPLAYATSPSGQAAQAAATGPNTLYFQGGQTINGQHNQDVYTAKPKVYLVFYGNQWGNETTNAQGYQAFSNDAANAAVAAQQLFKGLGTNNESWSGVMTQYCDGPTVAVNASVCPAAAPHVAYPTGGGVLAGIWYDNSGPTPTTATGDQLAAEAVAAATHFGNTTAASNRNAMYMVMSPKGANPDNYLNVNAGCAWHSDAFDANNNWVPFTNQPYNLDLNNPSGNCGEYFLGNSASDINDGYTITLGHEYAETLTDEYTGYGWLTPTASDGGENGDHCAWDATSAFVNFSSGAVAMQPTWSNDTNRCDMSHVTVVANTVTVTNPGSQSGTVGTATSLQINAADSSSTATVTYMATGLPAGLSISTSTGLISGTPTAAGTSAVTVTATDNTSVSGTASFSWTIAPAPTLTTGGNATGATFTSNASGALTTTPRITAAANSVDGSVITMSPTGLPAGLALNRIGAATSAAGVRPGTTEHDVTGQTTVTPGSYPVTVTVSDGPGHAADTTVSFTIVVPDPALIAPNVNVPPFQSDKPFTYQIQASGGTGAYTYTFIPNSHTPRGVTMDANGLIHANVPMNNVDISTGWTFSYQATDAYGGTARGTVNLTLTPGDLYFRCLGTTSAQAGNCAAHNLSDPAVGGVAHVGQAWATQVIKVGRGWSAPSGSGGGDRFTLYKGTLPPGMWLSPINGWYGKQYVLIGGTPSRAGTYTFQIKATDQHGNYQVSYFTITVR